jgi:solute carrier family 25 oxoglutarate transporter 11
MRQVVYTGARLGLYDIFTEKVKSPDEKTLPLYKTAGCALAAGGLGATIGNPADLALIRMQTDSMLPEAERKNYTGVGSALGGIIKGEGFMGLFAGAGPTATRAMALNLGMLAGNSKAKDFIADFGGPAKGTGSNTFGASCIAGFLGAFFCLPFDYVKTQIQKMKPNAEGVMPYTGPIDCAKQTLAKGGPTAFYAGFPVFYFRIAPHAMITLLAQNEVKKLWSSMGI